MAASAEPVLNSGVDPAVHEHEEALARLLFLTEQHRGGGLLAGAPGCGKSRLCQVLAQQASQSGRRVIVVDATGLTGAEWLKQMLLCSELNPVSGDVRALWHAVNDLATGWGLVGESPLWICDHVDQAAESLWPWLHRWMRLWQQARVRSTLIVAAENVPPAGIADELFELQIRLVPAETDDATFLDQGSGCCPPEPLLSSPTSTRKTLDPAPVCEHLDKDGPFMSYAHLADLIATKKAVIGVIGLGYVGLPLIRAFTASGFRCMGFDVDQTKVDKLKAGQSYIKHIDSAAIKQLIDSKSFEPSADMSRLKEADCIIICVPTPLNESRDPDLSYIEGTAHSIAKTLRPGQLVVLESTTHPTTTRVNVLPVMEATGLKIGKDYFLAFSPEREDPGNAHFQASTIPKVVGGYDPASGDLACAMYGHAVVKVVRVSSMEVAEACKILENTYRAVNIALVNELKMLYDKMGIDVWEVIDAAKTKPFGFQAFYPGPGLGGHCIPIDPFYLTWLARKWGEQTRFIELAGEINTHMPHYVINCLAEFLNDAGKPVKGSKVLILGAAYKKDVDDPRESPSFELMKLLMKRGAVLSYNDPHVPSLPKMRHYPDLPAMDSVALTPASLGSQDCVLISTDHSAYDYDFIVQHSRMVLDTRNATKNVKSNREKIRKA